MSQSFDALVESLSYTLEAQRVLLTSLLQIRQFLSNEEIDRLLHQANCVFVTLLQSLTAGITFSVPSTATVIDASSSCIILFSSDVKKALEALAQCPLNNERILIVFQNLMFLIGDLCCHRLQKAQFPRYTVVVSEYILIALAHYDIALRLIPHQSQRCCDRHSAHLSLIIALSNMAEHVGMALFNWIREKPLIDPTTRPLPPLEFRLNISTSPFFHVCMIMNILVCGIPCELFRPATVKFDSRPFSACLTSFLESIKASKMEALAEELRIRYTEKYTSQGITQNGYSPQEKLQKILILLEDALLIIEQSHVRTSYSESYLSLVLLEIILANKSYVLAVKCAMYYNDALIGRGATENLTQFTPYLSSDSLLEFYIDIEQEANTLCMRCNEQNSYFLVDRLMQEQQRTIASMRQFLHHMRVCIVLLAFLLVKVNNNDVPEAGQPLTRLAFSSIVFAVRSTAERIKQETLPALLHMMASTFQLASQANNNAIPDYTRYDSWLLNDMLSFFSWNNTTSTAATEKLAIQTQSWLHFSGEYSLLNDIFNLSFTITFIFVLHCNQYVNPRFEKHDTNSHNNMKRRIFASGLFFLSLDMLMQLRGDLLSESDPMEEPCTYAASHSNRSKSAHNMASEHTPYPGDFLSNMYSLYTGLQLWVINGLSGQKKALSFSFGLSVHDFILNEWSFDKVLKEPCTKYATKTIRRGYMKPYYSTSSSRNNNDENECYGALIRILYHKLLAHFCLLRSQQSNVSSDKTCGEKSPSDCYEAFTTAGANVSWKPLSYFFIDLWELSRSISFHAQFDIATDEVFQLLLTICLQLVISQSLIILEILHMLTYKRQTSRPYQCCPESRILPRDGKFLALISNLIDHLTIEHHGKSAKAFTA